MMMVFQSSGVFCVKNTFIDEVADVVEEVKMRHSKSCRWSCRFNSETDIEDITPVVTDDESDEEPTVKVCSWRTLSWGSAWDARGVHRATHRAAGDDWMQMMASDSKDSDGTASTDLPGACAGQVTDDPAEVDSFSDTEELPTCRVRTLSWSSRSDGRHESFWNTELGYHSFSADEQSDNQAPSMIVSEIAEGVLGKVWELSQTAQGCREVQAALEEPGSEDALRAITLELKTHIAEGLYCPYANFVLQKCITLLPEEDLDFMFQELILEGPEKAAKQKFGCRVTQRLASKAPETWGLAVGEALLGEFQSIACHPYGNYVLQHLLENGADCTRAAIALAALQNLSFLVSDTFGAAVVSGALKSALALDRVALARALVNDSDSLVALALSRHGHGSVMVSLDLVTCEESRAASLWLLQRRASISTTKFGRTVLESLQMKTKGL
eukprot:CAMPEP_0206452546 /NCGR_PEP_ID=MMETSP0324_2-20121206/20012_1 /ASSEMBLY_ACC=CAM_ASM_000836 /TAXON_ID=2866 /ORGANISM="Crypthecodinium cohnii, Strain Seligo" /LENGTH=441 /DNA_ID=CAMNT_0053922661 /DNA_START=123 /DNA_END=1448 /DNA_ORIENTATION=+